MARYIDADLLKLQIERGAEMTERGIRLLDLSQQPTVDAAPVVHGRWIKAVAYDFAGILGGYKCSICGRFCADNTEPYCHCGAKMDGKDDAK